MDGEHSAEIQRAKALRDEVDRYIRSTLKILTDADLDARHPGRTASLRATGNVLRLPDPDGGHPVFQFDDDLAVIPIVAEINEMLEVSSAPTAAASWWATPHAQLSGQAPFSLAGEPGSADRLRSAASATISIDY